MKPIVVFNHTLHKKLWDWLAANPGRYKEDWPGWSGLDMAPYSICNDCFACEAVNSLAIDVADTSWSCRYCPLDWGKRGDCTKLFGLFDSWHDATADGDRRSAARLAGIIRDLPVREPEDIALVVI